MSQGSPPRMKIAGLFSREYSPVFGDYRLCKLLLLLDRILDKLTFHPVSFRVKLSQYVRVAPSLEPPKCLVGAKKSTPSPLFTLMSPHWSRLYGQLDEFALQLHAEHLPEVIRLDHRPLVIAGSGRAVRASSSPVWTSCHSRAVGPPCLRARGRASA